jgi:hypothetical protein
MAMTRSDFSGPSIPLAFGAFSAAPACEKMS